MRASSRGHYKDRFALRAAHIMRATSLILLLATACAAPSGLNAAENDKPKPEPEIKVTGVELSTDLNTGAATIRFHVDAPEGTRFYTEYERRGQRGFSGTNFIWEIATDDGADVEVKFEYPIGIAGNRSLSTLDSQQDRLQYHAEVKGARNNNAYTTIVGAPLPTAAENDRSITIIQDDADPRALTSTGARRILLAIRKADAAIDPDKVEPRTELIVGLDHTPRTLPWLHPRTIQLGPPLADGIRSAHVTYRRVRLGRGNTLKPLSPAEVAKIIDSADLDQDPDAATALPAQVTKLNVNWSPGEFIMDGVTTREIHGTEDLVCDGKWEVYRSVPHQQLDVRREGDVPTDRDYVARFRLEAPPASPESVTTTQQTLDVDPATKFVRRLTFGNPQTGTFSDSRQFAPKTFAPDQILPRLALRAGFRDGKLTSFEITAIDDAHFNEPIDPQSFLLFAAAGTRITIHSSDSDRPRAASPEEDVPDVIAYVREKNLLTDPKSQLIEATSHHLFDGFDLAVHLSGRSSLPDTLVDELAKIEGVKQVIPSLLDVILLADARLPFGTDPADSPAAFLLGYPLDSPQMKALNVQSDGRNFTEGDRQKILIGRNLAKRTGKRVGDEIRLYRSEKFQIVGIFFSTRPFENDSLIIPLAELQRLMNRPGEVTSFSITANQPIDAKNLEALRQRLQSVQTGLQVSTVNKPSPAAAPNETRDDKNAP